MESNKNDALKLAIIQGMSAMLAAVDNAGTTSPTGKPTTKAAKPTKKDKPKAKDPHTDTHTKKKHISYCVEDLRALYKLADAELLDKINGVLESRKYPGTRMYFVDKTPETKSALAVFLTQEELAEDVQAN